MNPKKGKSFSIEISIPAKYQNNLTRNIKVQKRIQMELN